MPLTFNGFPLLTTTEVRGEAMAKWPPFGRAYQSLICLSVVFALLSTLSLFLCVFFVYGNRCANYAMRNVIGKWQLVE